MLRQRYLFAAGAALLLLVSGVGHAEGGGAPFVRVKHAASTEIERVGLESYVAAVVAAEVPGHWPPAALRAQAVASRSYALYRQRRSDRAEYDVESDTQGQVFGSGPLPASVQDAVRMTAGEVLLYQGRPALAVFHSASGGQTASAAEVWGQAHAYLTSVAVAEEHDAPSTYWRAVVSRPTLRRTLAGMGRELGEVESVRVETRTPSGRVARLRLRGSSGDAVLTGREFRLALGVAIVKSTLFEVRTQGTDFVLVGTGHGHGVGMSQWGARAMAKRGANHHEILSAFYRGAEIVRLEPDALRALAQPDWTLGKDASLAASGELR